MWNAPGFPSVHLSSVCSSWAYKHSFSAAFFKQSVQDEVLMLTDELTIVLGVVLVKIILSDNFFPGTQLLSYLLTH